MHILIKQKRLVDKVDNTLFQIEKLESELIIASEISGKTVPELRSNILSDGKTTIGTVLSELNNKFNLELSILQTINNQVDILKN